MSLFNLEGDNLNKIADRIESGESFTFSQLHGNDDLMYRKADRLIQKYRKAGFISFKRIGRYVWWSLTPDAVDKLKGGDA